MSAARSGIGTFKRGSTVNPDDIPEDDPTNLDGASQWPSRAAMDCDAIAVLTAATLGDPDGAMAVLESLSSGQLIALVWVLAGWWAWAFEHGHGRDPVAALRKIGLAIAQNESEGQ
jgi:hypothetical protein